MSKFSISNLDLYYDNGAFKALKNINLEIPANEITAFIGPSGCGKSTLLKSLNRMNDLVEGCKITGKVLLDGEDIYGDMNINLLRKRVGMVFQKPNPFPMSIYDNIAYGPRTHGIRSKVKLDDIKSMKGVLGCQFSSGQFQVIIGQTVEHVYKEVCTQGGFTLSDSIEEPSEKTKEKWEQGVNPIKGTASRLLYLLNKYDWLLDEFYVFERNDEYCQLQNDYKIKVIPTRKKIKKETNTKFVKNNDCIEINQMLYKEKSQSQQDASTSCYI